MGRFTKGLVKDTSTADQPAGTWRHARNAVVNRIDGAISTEGGAEFVTNIGRRKVIVGISEEPEESSDKGAVKGASSVVTYDGARAGYVVVGTIETTDDRIVIFSVNTMAAAGGIPASADLGRSEVGIYSAGVYNTVLNIDVNAHTVDTDLKFNTSHPVSGTYKVDANGNLFVYFTDNVNPPRCLNVTRQFPGGTSTNTEFLYKVDPDTSPNKNYIDRLNLYPHSGPVPHIDLKSVNSGGGLVTAMYALALAYVDVDLVATNFLTVDNPVLITDSVENIVPIEKYDGAKAGSQTGKSITWDVSNINTDYEYLRAVIIQTVGGVQFAYQINDTLITSTESTVTFTGVEGYTQASVEEVIIDTVQYDTVKSLEQVDGVLYSGNLAGSLDVGFQKHAGDIELTAVTKELNEFDLFDVGHANLTTGIGNITPMAAPKTNGYRDPVNSYKYKGYARDEVYAMYIAFVLNSGAMSYAYHIPGRKPITISTTALYQNWLSGSESVWNSELIDVGETDIHSDSDIKSLGDDVKIFAFEEGSGDDGSLNMNYWENASEYYPDTNDYADGAFKVNGEMGKVRHHRFPGNVSGAGFNNGFYKSNADSEFTSGDADVVTSWTGPEGDSNCEFNTNDIEDIGFSYDSINQSWTAIRVNAGGNPLPVGLSYTILWKTNHSNYQTWYGTLLEVYDGWYLFNETGGDAPVSANSEWAWQECTVSLSSAVDASTITEGAVASNVRALGFTLDNIKIPEEIADKVQGFRIYYAKREHVNKTILGQGVIIPYSKTEESFGGCNYPSGGSSDVLGNGNTESILTKMPFLTSTVFNSVSQFTDFAFYSFELLRTKNSIAAATHISVEGLVTYHTWAGPAVNHFPAPSGPSCQTISMRSTLGVIKSIFHVDNSSVYGRHKLINANCKTYVGGDTIFDARGLGFDSKINNRGGESHIALSAGKHDNPLPTVVYHSAASTPFTTAMWNSETEPFKYLPATLLKTYLISLRAYKTDVYNSLDSQTLVWTGFEVLGDDFKNFIVDEPEATHSVSTINEEGIFGGDTFLCRYGFRQSLSPKMTNTEPTDRIGVLFAIVESTDNINLRHEEGPETAYFPGSPAKKFMFGDREGLGYDTSKYFDYNKQENVKYNSDYSLVNDIRPAIPLPLLTTNPTSFPTRIIRSTKSDPGSLIDNFRIHLSLQYKDLPKNRGSLSRLAAFSNMLYMHMEDSLFVTKGKEKLQLGSASEAFIGSGDIFQQEPDELIQTEAGYGGTRSQYAGLVTRYGYFSLDIRSKTVYLTSNNMVDISNVGMEKWFQKNIPFQLYDDYGVSFSDDSPIEGVGYTSVWDAKYKRILLTKRDLVPTDDFKSRFAAGALNGNPYTADEYIESTTVTTTTVETAFTKDEIDFTEYLEDVYVAPIYALSVTGDDINLDERESTTITLTTTGVADGDIPFAITGTVSTSDYTIDGATGATGVFSIVSGTASIVVAAIEDSTTEAATETLTLILDESANVNHAITLNIADTSLTPHTLSVSSASILEGFTTIVTLNTTGLTDGDTVPYTISSAAGGFSASSIDVGLTGNFTVTSNTATLSITPTVNSTQSDDTSFTLTLDSPQTTAVSITIVDNSSDPSAYTIGTYYPKFGGIVIGGVPNVNTRIMSAISYSGTWATANAHTLSEAGASNWSLATSTNAGIMYDAMASGAIELAATLYWTDTSQNSSFAGAYNMETDTMVNTNKSTTLEYRMMRIHMEGDPYIPVIGEYIDGGYVFEVTPDGSTAMVVADTNFTHDGSGQFTGFNTWAALFPYTFEGTSWDFPTIGNLESIYSVLPQLESIVGFSLFFNAGYWSSTPGGTGVAWNLNFNNGSAGPSVVATSFRVRGVKTINLSTSRKGVRSDLELAGGAIRVTAVTSNSFTLENLTGTTVYGGIKFYIPAAAVELPVPENVSWKYSVDAGLVSNIAINTVSEIIIGGTQVQDADTDGSIDVSNVSFTPTGADTTEVYFALTLAKLQTSTLTLNTLDLVKDTEVVVVTPALNLTHNGAIVLGRDSNSFELIEYEKDSHEEVRTTIELSEKSLIKGVPQFERIGWTISYYPEYKFWGSVHDYVPSLYSYDSSYMYSFSSDPTTSFGSIYRHDALTDPGNFYGTVYPFEVEFVDNTERNTSKIFSSFGYETEVFNKGKRVFEDGFSTFYVFNSSQCSGTKKISYFTSGGGTAVRKVANEWRINQFRDMANIATSSSGTLNPVDNVSMFTVQGMVETLNSVYIDEYKPWHQQKKFTDSFVGIRLISDNSRKNLVDLYSTSTAIRKHNR